MSTASTASTASTDGPEGSLERFRRSRRITDVRFASSVAKGFLWLHIDFQDGSLVSRLVPDDYPVLISEAYYRHATELIQDHQPHQESEREI